MAAPTYESDYIEEYMPSDVFAGARANHNPPLGLSLALTLTQPEPELKPQPSPNPTPRRARQLRLQDRPLRCGLL